MDLSQKDKQRFTFLESLYRVTDGYSMSMVNMWGLGEELNFDREVTNNVVDWLVHEGLVQYMALGGEVGITHSGVQEVEQAKRHPEQGTTHFAPINIINIQSMNNSQLQQGTVNSSQSLTQLPSDALQKVRDGLVDLRARIEELSLDPDRRQEVDVQLATVETQLKSKRPVPVIIREGLKTLRNLLEGTAAGVAATGLLGLLGTLR